MKATTVADRILCLSSTQIAPRRLDLVVTAIMLQRAGYNALIGYDGIRKRRYKIDHRFVVDLLRATKDQKIQLAIVASPAFASLTRSMYRRLFLRYWRLHRRDEAWRYALGWSLGPYLMNNPQDGPLYAEPIWTMAMDPNEAVACEGLSKTQYLGDVLTLEQWKALIAFTHHGSVRAGAAMSNLGTLYKALKNPRPEVRALLLSPATIATLRSANPPDGRDKNSCYRWCIDNMRKALARARPGRVPRAV